MEAVCAEGLSLDMLDGLASLIDKSLVQQIDSWVDEPRFTMLETFREYAVANLNLANAIEIQQRHRDWFLQLAEDGEAGLRSPHSRAWFKRLQQEEDNMRSALEWSQQETDDDQAGLRLAGSLWHYWHMCGKYQEGRGWLTLLLSQVQSIATTAHAQVLNGAGVMAYRQGDYDEITRLCGEALAISDELGDRNGAALALHYLAHVAQQQGDFDKATEVLALSLDIYREQRNDWGSAQTLNCLGDLHRQLGQDIRAQALLEDALALQRRLDSQRGVAIVLHNLGHVLCRQKDIERAKACFRESLEIARDWAGEPDVVLGIGGFAGVAAASGQPERAARLLGVVDTMLPVVGYVLEPPDRADYDRIVSETRAQLDDARFQYAWAAGQQLSLEDAMQYALDDTNG